MNRHRAGRGPRLRRRAGSSPAPSATAGWRRWRCGRFAHEATQRDGYLAWDLDYIWAEVVGGAAGRRRPLPRRHQRLGRHLGRRLRPPRCRRRSAHPRPRLPRRAHRPHPRGVPRTASATRPPGTPPASPRPPSTPPTSCSPSWRRSRRSRRGWIRSSAARLLHLPALRGPGWSRSHASSTGLCRPGAHEFSDEVFDALGIPRRLGGGGDPEHAVVGPCTVAGLEQLTVVAAGAHDTACAVHALQRDVDDESYFLSCGSWSVLGVLRDEPLMSREAYQSGSPTRRAPTTGYAHCSTSPVCGSCRSASVEWRAAGGVHDIVDLVELGQGRRAAGLPHQSGRAAVRAARRHGGAGHRSAALPRALTWTDSTRGPS